MRLAIVAAILACVGATAWADDPGKAHAAYRSGTQHYDLGEYREALEAFKEAYRNHEDPTFIFNLAQSYRQPDAHLQGLVAVDRGRGGDRHRGGRGSGRGALAVGGDDAQREDRFRHLSFLTIHPRGNWMRIRPAIMVVLLLSSVARAAVPSS